MSTFRYRRELKKWMVEVEEVDEEELLATLSPEELQELESELAYLDPDINIPIGLRQKDQTAKAPTGTYDRDALLKYWEDDNKKLRQDEKVESNPGQGRWPDRSRGERVSVASTNASKTLKSSSCHCPNKGKTTLNVCATNDLKVEKIEKKIECKKETLIRSKCSQNNGLSQSLRTETANQNLNVSSDRPSGNPVIIDKALEQILGDDPTVTEVNLNNVEDIAQETLLRFAEALCINTHVQVFSLANTHADDRVAFAISKMLIENCSIRSLNIESNFVSGQGILALLAALQHNRTLVELRFHNQRHICGGRVEMEMVQLLRENTTLLKLGYQFDLPGPRMTATSILTRNQDQQRQRRLQQKKEQSPPEVSGQGPGSSAENRPKMPTRSFKAVENQNRHPPPPSVDPPTRTMAETVKQHECRNSTKGRSNQRKPKSNKLKSGSDENESADILKELKNALKPPLQRRRDELYHLPLPQRSSHDDLMAAIRGSSIRSLKKVDASQT
uniref:Leiomodin-3 n=1 Tax=Monopterus albus TaxID=43700 RepID=A0A3Q3JX33_MONAL